MALEEKILAQMHPTTTSPKVLVFVPTDVEAVVVKDIIVLNTHDTTTYNYNLYFSRVGPVFNETTMIRKNEAITANQLEQISGFFPLRGNSMLAVEVQQPSTMTITVFGAEIK